MFNDTNNSDKTMKRIKSVILGNSAAGKTCIVQRMIYNTFTVNSTQTIGAAFSIYTVESNIKIEIWDTAGQERFHSLLPMYARGAEIIIVVVDINKNIDEQILKWNKYIQDNEKLFVPYYKLFLIFNKHDLNSDFQIPTNIVNQSQFVFITLVSAKTGYGIDKLKLHMELNSKKIIDDNARRSHESSSIDRNHNSGNSNIQNNTNDTIFSSLSNMKVNVEEYRDKMKKYYEDSRC